MNKNDLRLIIIVIILAIILFFVPKLFVDNGLKEALVYYDNKLIKTISLNIDKRKEYYIEGNNGDVIIETKKNMVRVKEEISPLHLCSKQGWITSAHEMIVCLPNKVVIKIKTKEKELDAIVR